MNAESTRGTRMRGTSRTVWGMATSFALAAAMACGSDGDSPSGPTDGGNIGATIAITSAGISPSNVTVAVGQRVTFTNNDSQPHDMNSDPHPEHTSCPDLNVGTIQPGQSRTSQNLNTARTCGFHDHINPNTASLRGSVRIQ